MLTAPRTIAFAGPPGCGKSSLINALCDALPSATAIAMDDFSGPETLAATHLDGWLEAGGDFSALDISSFCAALAQLKAQKSLIPAPVAANLPAPTLPNASQAHPAEIILAEAPLGRAHRGSASLIDTLLWIDVPLDLALARNLLIFCQTEPAPPPGWIAGYLEQYSRITRRVLEHQYAVVRPGADHMLDGSLPLPALVESTLRLIAP